MTPPESGRQIFGSNRECEITWPYFRLTAYLQVQQQNFGSSQSLGFLGST